MIISGRPISPDNGTIGSPATYDGFVPVAAALDKFSLAYFSSYGPAPDLTFAPYLAAPGVAIRSSVNFNQYALKSGTSMAAPCIAGVFAALSGALEQKGLLPSGEERAQRLTALLMNTAIPLENEDGLVPVRGQGAGVYRTDRASVSTAIALGESGDPFVELGKLPANVNGRTVTLTLQNFGSAPVRYSIPAQTVYTEDTAAPSQRCVAIPGARWTPSADSVEVPAGQSVQVTFTLETAADLAGYLEGYFCLIGEGVPDLNVPYLGFCGDERGPMVLTQGELAPTMMALTMDGETPSFEPAGALSPNADGYCDVLVPFYFQLRNAQRVDYSILDADYQTVTECAQVVGVPKDLYQSCVDDGLAGKFDVESPQPMLALTGWYCDAHANAIRPAGQRFLCFARHIAWR